MTTILLSINQKKILSGKVRTKKELNRSNDSFDEIGVVSEYEDRGLALVEEIIYEKYLTKPRGRILDVGCYVGRISFPLARKGHDVFGIDTASIGIKRAAELKKEKKIWNAHFILASATKVPFQNKMFDYVLFPYNTIEGIPLKQLRIEAMEEAARTLKKDGLVLFSAHNRLYPKYFIGIMVLETVKVFLRLLVLTGMDRFLPPGIRKNVKVRIRTETGSILIVEPGGSKYTVWHFSTIKEVEEMIKRSSLRLMEKIPVMDHGPQKINADILQNSCLNFIKAPVFYYICRKSET